MTPTRSQPSRSRLFLVSLALNLLASPLLTGACSHNYHKTSSASKVSLQYGPDPFSVKKSSDEVRRQVFRARLLKQPGYLSPSKRAENCAKDGHQAGYLQRINTPPRRAPARALHPHHNNNQQRPAFQPTQNARSKHYARPTQKNSSVRTGGRINSDPHHHLRAALRARSEHSATAPCDLKNLLAAHGTHISSKSRRELGQLNKALYWMETMAPAVFGDDLVMGDLLDAAAEEVRECERAATSFDSGGA